MRVLVIEDSASYRELVVEVFRRIGMQAHAVESAEQGLAELEQDGYDVVCVDLHLPEMDGLALCQRLRQLEHGQLLPVILLTSDLDETLQRRAFEAGITEILHKTAAEPLEQALAAFVERINRRIEGRVLYIEDSRSVAELTKAFMTAAGLEVDHFCSADEALDAFKQKAFDLVVSDIIVEGKLSGVGLLRAIRSSESPQREIPFLAVSGKLDKQLKVAILRQGADDCIAKPLVQEEMLARISNLITKKRLFDQVLAQQQELKQLAVTDGLTGLYNKSYLDEAGRQMLSNASRQRYPLSVLVVDLDHFKKINDSYGHDTGDKVLTAVGKLLESTCRNGDLPARFGGEEFILYLPHCSLSNAREKAEQLRAAIENLHPAGLQVTASIGVSCTRKDEKIDYTDLFKQADEALYEAKRNGRNRVVCYSPALSKSA